MLSITTNHTLPISYVNPEYQVSYRTPWNLFCSGQYTSLCDNPDMKYRSIGRQLGSMWRSLQDAEDDLSIPYLKSLCDTSDVEKEYHRIRGVNLDSLQPHRTEKFLNTLGNLKPLSECKKPRSAYNLFCADNEKELGSHENMLYKSLGKELGKMWNVLPEKEKKKWRMKAMKDRMEWLKIHGDHDSVKVTVTKSVTKSMKRV